jgi:uncharacterized membrane protein YsdA (DUF1294 family)
MSHASPYQRFGLPPVLVAALAILVLVVLVGAHWYVAWVAGFSLVAVWFYWSDKRRAVAGRERIPELVLHGLALIGGFPGAWFGRYAFRHKTRKVSFLIVLVVATAIHGVIIWWLFIRGTWSLFS